MNANEITAECLVSTLEIHGVEPTDTFDAAAGAHYGRVKAWDLADGRYVVKYETGGEPEYAISAADGMDLSDWILAPDLDSIEQVVQYANVYGAEGVEDANPGADGPFYVLRTRYFFGPAEISEVVVEDFGHQPLSFDTYEEADGWINQQEGEIYVTAHNESGRPSYRIFV